MTSDAPPDKPVANPETTIEEVGDTNPDWLRRIGLVMFLSTFLAWLLAPAVSFLSITWAEAQWWIVAELILISGKEGIEMAVESLANRL